MTITWYGHSCFKIETRSGTLVTDPFPRELGLTPPRFRAELLLVSHHHPSHANIAAIPGEPFVISGPGEYERLGIEVRGIRTYHDARRGAERGLNTAYAITAEGMKLLHLGDYGEDTLRTEAADEIGAVDIILVPVGGSSTIGPGEAVRLIKQLEPTIVIPMHYRLPGLTAPLLPLELFLKELGVKEPVPLPKLTIKKKEVGASKEMLRVLSPVSAA